MTYEAKRGKPPAPDTGEDGRAAQCVGKDAYDSIELANKVRQRARGKAPVAPYRCDYCRKWHLGVHLQKKYRRNRR